jgi:uncharacterized damage-inducible protein DinB
MYHTIREFLDDWRQESALTQKLMNALTDASLAQRVAPGDRTLGRIAWHAVTAIPEMVGRTGLVIHGAPQHAAVPEKASSIADAYHQAAASLASQVESLWHDATLLQEDDMFGMMWSRGTTLQSLIRHEIHHRAQMTVLMRQAGLIVPGTYGPAREEWAQMGAPEPQL